MIEHDEIDDDFTGSGRMCANGCEHPAFGAHSICFKCVEEKRIAKWQTGLVS